MTDPNHDIVPTLRMFDGVMTGLAADEIERLRKRVAELEADAEAEPTMTSKLTDTTLMQLYTLANRHGYQAFARHAKNLLAPTQQPSGEVTEADLIALLPGTYYMDPPDGGDVSLLEQLRRMAADAGRYRWMRAHYTRFVALPDDGPELDLQAIGEIGDAYEGQVLDQTVDAARAQGGEKS